MLKILLMVSLLTLLTSCNNNKAKLQEITARQVRQEEQQRQAERQRKAEEKRLAALETERLAEVKRKREAKLIAELIAEAEEVVRLADLEAEKEQQRRTTNKFGMKFVRIPAGRFQMGDIQGGGNSDEKPVDWVNIKSFHISKTEVTQGQWQKVMGDNPSRFKKGANYPVEQVSWDDVQTYIRKLNQQTGKRYRLPSEAEWEYAARAGSNTKYSWGNYIRHYKANYGTDVCCAGLAQGKDKWENTAPVASFSPNAFGLYDMHGNVWEWTQDCWNDNYSRAPINGSAWESGNCAWRVLRGGSWFDVPRGLRSASRSWAASTFRDGDKGFRLVQDSNS